MVQCVVAGRADWKHVFCIPGFENMSSKDGSNRIKETQCAVKMEWKYLYLFFFGFIIFYFLFLFFIIFYVLNWVVVFRITK